MSEQERNIMNALIAIMRSKMAGLEIVVLASEGIIANALFNARIADLKSFRRLDEDYFLALADIAENVLVICEAAGRQFEVDGDSEKLKGALRMLKEQLDVQPALILKDGGRAG